MKSYRKPNFFYYNIIFRNFSRIYSKFALNLKVIRNEAKGVKGSFVCLANHESAIDFLALGHTLPRTNFVISKSFFDTLPLQKALLKAGVIPKQQFKTTTADLKKMKYVVDGNQPLTLYPAGLMSEDGNSTPIPESTVKFLKWLNQDVYIAKIKGTYLTKPKWSNVTRKGETTLDIFKLFTKEELSTISSKQIHHSLMEALDFDAYENQKELMIPFKKGDHLEGLESVLYKCPRCDKEFTIISRKNQLCCRNCGYTVFGDKYGFLNGDDVVFSHPSKWARNIKENLFEEIKDNQTFKLISKCKIHLLNRKKHRYEEKGEGIISLDREFILLNGQINNEVIEKSFYSNQYTSLPFKPNRHFEIQEPDCTYRILLENPVETTKWVWSIQVINKLFK